LSKRIPSGPSSEKQSDRPDGAPSKGRGGGKTTAIPYPEFWREFLATTNIQDADTRFHDVTHADDSMASMADAVQQILSGDKTAGSALLADYEATGREPPPRRGLSILVDESDSPIAVLETLESTITRFSDVDDAFARAHGQGQSLKSWRRQCRAAFAARARALGTPFGEDSLLVCHRFRVVFAPMSSGLEKNAG
jgi:uncharacterized protein YhfF